MTVPTEQQVLGEMGLKGMGRGIEAVCSLLIALGYEDVSGTLRLRWEEHSGWDDDDD